MIQESIYTKLLHVLIRTLRSDPKLDLHKVVNCLGAQSDWIKIVTTRPDVEYVCLEVDRKTIKIMEGYIGAKKTIM